MSLRMADRNVATFKSGTEKIIFAEGQGPYVTDTSGREYIDLVCGYGPVVIGHADPEFNAGIAALTASGIHFPGYSALHERYLNELDDLTPFHDYVASFFRSSSEAVTAALRISAWETQRPGVIRCGFTGWHDAQMANSVRWHEQLSSPLRTSNAVANQPWRGATGKEAVFNWIDLKIESLTILLEQQQQNVGALVIDAYQLSLSSDDILAPAIKLCRDKGVMVIFDQTKTAGRVGPAGLRVDQEDNRPDMIVLGKAIGNGTPLSLLLFDNALEEHFVNARVGGTYGKELTAVAGGLVTANIMNERHGWDRLKKIGTSVVDSLNAAIRQTSADQHWEFETRFGGSMFDWIFTDDLVSDLGKRQKIQQCYQDAGMLILQGHPSFVSLAHEFIPQDSIHERSIQAINSALDQRLLDS